MADKTSYDARCYELAELFLEDQPHLNNERRRDELAQAIQRAIEEYIGEEDRNYEPPDPPGWEGGFAENH